MNPQYLLEAIVAQRDDALNRLAQATVLLREKDEEIERLKPKRKAKE